jgi:ketosteroid isomerase-like protein
VWLQNWVAAMRTRDAAAQASFYADPVERYLGKSNLSNAEIQQDKRAAIVSREGLWTVKLEDITLNQQSPDEVNVHLVKHYMAETEPAQISEQFVSSRLKLRRINNQWKIISEQDES